MASNEIPRTRANVGHARADHIRTLVRSAESMATDAALSRLAQPEDAVVFLEFLSDPAVHAPIYTVPTVRSEHTIKEFIERHLKERDAGDGLLFLNFDRSGNLAGYTDVQVWPEWAAGELGGAVHPNRQGQGRGIEGARAGFDWMFSDLDLDLICETAAPDNIRTIRLLDGLGFQRCGEITSRRDDGSQRASLVWEMTREAWELAKQVET